MPVERLVSLLLGLRGATVLLAEGSMCVQHGPVGDERGAWRP